MKDRTVIFVIILAIFLLYFLGDYLGINSQVVGNRFCEDSDEGMKVYMPGHVVSDLGTFRDRCNTGEKSVREYYCEEDIRGKDRVKSNFIQCGPGYYCERDVIGQDDACIKD